MSKEKLIPELRFPEFEKDGEWIEKTIEDFAPLQRGFDLPVDDIIVGDYPVVFSNGILKYHKEYKVKAPGVVTGRSGTIGKVTYVEKDFWPHNTTLWVTDFCDNFPLFVYHYFVRIGLDQFSAGGGVPTLNRNDVHRSKIFIPTSNDEQKKIASCLSSLDEVIATHSQKLDVLKDHKKGLMQNLFPQMSESGFTRLKDDRIDEADEQKILKSENPDSDNIPKYRFKEFEKDGEWVQKKLGEVAEIITGNTPSTTETAYYGGDKMFVSPADINDNRFVSKTKTSLTQLGFSKTRQIKAGSVLFVCIGSTIGKIAQNKFDCATNQQLNSLVAFSDYSSDYLYSLLDANSSEIASIAGNHAVPIINKSSFSDIKLPFPSSLEEQQKIASCLSSLDALITAQLEKIAQLKLHKKGLMQGLFPKIND